MSNKLFLFFLMLLLAITSISSQDDVTHRVGESFEMINFMILDNTSKCTNCTCEYSIYYPNGSFFVEDVAGTNDDGKCKYTTTINSLGEYGVDMYFTNGSYSELLSYDIIITPSGNSGTSNLVFSLFVIILVYAVTFVGFFYGRNIPVTIIGGMAMIFLGVYLINNGIIIYRDDLTNYISYLTIGIGFIMSSWAGLEQLDIL